MNNQLVVKESDITDSVLSRVKSLEGQGGLRLPQNYSAENALKSAYLILQETTNKAGKCALVHCTKVSIANSLLDMVVQGLNPTKKQCYFIMYDEKLQLLRSYMGTIAVAKRHGVIDIRANVIYKDDEFEFEIDALTGDREIIKHKQSLSSLNGEIVGAYAILTLNNENKYIEIMSIKQIRNSWNRGTNKGGSMAHKDHPEEMCKKTVITRACKLFINTSDDSALFDADDEFDRKDHVKSEISTEANQGTLIDFDSKEYTENPENTDNNTITDNGIDQDFQMMQEALNQQLATESLEAGF